jgi:hypothetical protein
LQKVRFWDPEHWRFRAEETRTVADQMTHEEARTIMRRIALDYDRLAKVAEEQLADQERGAIGDKAIKLRTDYSLRLLLRLAQGAMASTNKSCVNEQVSETLVVSTVS